MWLGYLFCVGIYKVVERCVSKVHSIAWSVCMSAKIFSAAYKRIVRDWMDDSLLHLRMWVAFSGSSLQRGHLQV